MNIHFISYQIETIGRCKKKSYADDHAYKVVHAHAFIQPYTRIIKHLIEDISLALLTE